MILCFECNQEILASDQYLTVWSEFERIERFHMCCALTALKEDVVEPRLQEDYESDHAKRLAP